MADSRLNVILALRDQASGKLENFSKRTRGLGLAVTAMGAAVVGFAALSIKNFAEVGDQIQKTGFSTEELSKLRFAAEQSGTNLEGLATGIRTMQKRLLDAERGLSTATDALELLGVSTEDFLGLNPEKQFALFAEALGGVEDASRRAALAQEIFGRAGTQLLPLFAQGAEGMEELKRQAEEMGIVFDQEAADAAARFNDSMNELSKSFEGVKFALAENLAPAISDVIDRVSGAVQKFQQWRERNPQLSDTLIKVGLALGGILAVIGPLLLVLPTVVAMFIRLGSAVIFAKGALLGPKGLGIALAAMGVALGLMTKLSGEAIARMELFGAASEQAAMDADKLVKDILSRGFELEQAKKDQARATEILSDAELRAQFIREQVVGGLDDQKARTLLVAQANGDLVDTLQQAQDADRERLVEIREINDALAEQADVTDENERKLRGFTSAMKGMTRETLLLSQAIEIVGFDQEQILGVVKQLMDKLGISGQMAFDLIADEIEGVARGQIAELVRDIVGLEDALDDLGGGGGGGGVGGAGGGGFRGGGGGGGRTAGGAIGSNNSIFTSRTGPGTATSQVGALGFSPAILTPIRPLSLEEAERFRELFGITSRTAEEIQEDSQRGRDVTLTLDGEVLARNQDGQMGRTTADAEQTRMS